MSSHNIMFFLIDNNKKIVLGWSAKCGCSHIKKIFFYLRDDKILNYVHVDDKNNIEELNMGNYIVIIISRNPYERIISGLLDKYKPNGEFRNRWKDNTLSFTLFVDKLVNNNWHVIDKHHFTPQTSEKFNENKLKNCKKLIICDVNNIDYELLESIYNKKIPNDLINFKGTHTRMLHCDSFKGPVYDLDMSAYYTHNVKTHQFYNDELLKKIYNFYKDDFLFFEKNGIRYDSPH